MAINSLQNKNIKEGVKKGCAELCGSAAKPKEKQLTQVEAATKRGIVCADEGVTWITVSGQHIPIKSGQSKEDAIASALSKKYGVSHEEAKAAYKSGRDMAKGTISQEKKGPFGGPSWEEMNRRAAVNKDAKIPFDQKFKTTQTIGSNSKLKFGDTLRIDGKLETISGQRGTDVVLKNSSGGERTIAKTELYTKIGSGAAKVAIKAKGE